VDQSPIGESYRQPLQLFRNLRNGRFANITAQAGPGFAAVHPARGLATGDFDGDGRPEIVIVNRNETPTLLKNLGTRGSAIAVALTGTRSNRSAIGARVIVEAGGHRQMSEVTSGGSYYSQNSMTLHFGLGAATALDRLEIRWPSGLTQRWTGVAANRTLRITEGSDSMTCSSWAAAEKCVASASAVR
jgi:hypothetical protein